MPVFSSGSLEKLSTCNPQLIHLFNEVIKVYDCTILEGFRGADRQNYLFVKGYSQVMFPNSYHNRYPSRAVDVAPWPIDWHNINRFIELSGVVKTLAKQLNIHIEWGGDWRTFKDYPHWQIPDVQKSTRS